MRHQEVRHQDAADEDVEEREEQAVTMPDGKEESGDQEERWKKVDTSVGEQQGEVVVRGQEIGRDLRLHVRRDTLGNGQAGGLKGGKVEHDQETRQPSHDGHLHERMEPAPAGDL